MSLRENIEKFMTEIKPKVCNIKAKITPEVRSKVRTIWECFNIGVIGLNSFILIYFHQRGNEGMSDMNYVICAAAAAYAIVFLTETILLRNNPQRLPIVRKTKTIFRLIYTAVYLTVIMLDIIVVSERPNPQLMMAYYGAMFIWVALWGTNCLWIKKLYPRLMNFYKENKTQIIGFFRRFNNE